jgi:hypothetical protein
MGDMTLVINLHFSWDAGDEFAGRIYVDDPLGNRIELIEAG